MFESNQMAEAAPRLENKKEFKIPAGQNQLRAGRRSRLLFLTALFVAVLCTLTLSTSLTPIQAAGNVYYMSPTGSDSNPGTEAQPWASFNRAWNSLYPGDTLVLLDGVYYQTLRPNRRNGQQGSPITIKAKNDGKAIIDGQFVRDVVFLGDTWPGPIGSWFVIEGIIGRNAVQSVFFIRADNNVLRRVSGYNAHTDKNAHVYTVWASNNLIEDCIAAGTGRKMIMLYEGSNNTVRRCLADWSAWDGREFCGITWPWGDGIQIYSGDNSIVENSIVYGQLPAWGVSIQANDYNLSAVNNKVLGTMALQVGVNKDNSIKQWGTVRPTPNSCPDMVSSFNWPGMRSGFMLYGQGELRNNLFRDIFSWGNAGLGLTFVTISGLNPKSGNNIIDHATIINNGKDNPDGPWPGQNGGKNVDVLDKELALFNGVTNSYIQTVFRKWDNYPGGSKDVYTMNGPGARLTNRYVDGVLTGQPLWPWPMEERVKNELGYSVTNLVGSIAGLRGFNLIVTPKTGLISSGGSADVNVTIQPTGDFNEKVTLTTTTTSNDVQITPATYDVPNGSGQFTLKLTDLNPPSFTGPDSHRVTITATANGITRTADVILLVNSKKYYMPMVNR